MTIEVFSERSGRSRMTVMRAEKGQCTPTMAVLSDFAHVLGVDVCVLFEHISGGAR